MCEFFDPLGCKTLGAGATQRSALEIFRCNAKCGGDVPIWAVVEIMNWGMLSYRCDMSLNLGRQSIVDKCKFSAPRVTS